MDEMVILAGVVILLFAVLMTWLITGLYFVEQLRVMERITEEVMTENAALKREKNEVQVSEMPPCPEGQAGSGGQESPLPALRQDNGFAR